MWAHDPGPDHPESPARARAIMDALGHPSSAASIEEADFVTLRRVHTQAHIEYVLSARGTHKALDPDTIASPGSVHAALLAAKAGCVAVDMVMGAQAKAAWSLGRPPGHHAEADQVMGYCVFNNIAIAAAYALEAYPELERVLIVDWDVHHGNGTQHIFDGDGRVLFFDLHQDDHYPEMGDIDERGLGDALGTTWNVPFKAGATGADYLVVLDRLLPQLFERHKPGLLLVSTGFDPHINDPLGDMKLGSEDFAQMALRLQRLADEHTGGKMVMLLEGGYDLDGLSTSVAACVSALRSPSPPQPHPLKPHASTIAIIEEHERWLAASG